MQHHKNNSVADTVSNLALSRRVFIGGLRAIGLNATLQRLLPRTAAAAFTSLASAAASQTGTPPTDPLAGAKTAIIFGHSSTEYLLGRTAEMRVGFGTNLMAWRNVFDVVPIRADQPGAGYMLALDGYFVTSDLRLSASVRDAVVLVISGSSPNFTIGIKGSDLVLTRNNANSSQGSRFAASGTYNTLQNFGIQTTLEGDAFFWLTCSGPTQNGSHLGTRALQCDLDGGSTTGLPDESIRLRAYPQAVDFNQLWRYDTTDFCIYNRRNARVLTCSATPGTLSAAFKANDPTMQRWDLVRGIGLVNRATSQVLKYLYDQNVIAAPKPNAPVTDETLAWTPRQYSPAPKLTNNMLDRWANGRLFQICSAPPRSSLTIHSSIRHDVGTATSLSSQAVPTSRTEPIPKELAWRTVDGTLVNFSSGAASILVGRNDGTAGWSLACVPNADITAADLSAAKWILTANGVFVHAQSGRVLQADIANYKLVLTPFDPMRPESQCWMVMTGIPGTTTGSGLGSGSSDLDENPWLPGHLAGQLRLASFAPPVRGIVSIESPSNAFPLASTAAFQGGGTNDPHPAMIVTKLIVEVQIGDRWFAGTDAPVFLSFNGHDEIQMSGYGYSSRWSSGETYSGNLSSLVRQWTFDQVQTLFVRLDQALISDEVFIDSVKVTINDKYVCHADVSDWVEDFTSLPLPQHLWKMIDPSQPSQPGKTFDWSGKTYSVGVIPWLSDVKSWRSYNPSTIDGVGILLGSRNGRLIGCQMKSGQCEEIAINGTDDSYTWVFTPQGSIIYKKWDKKADASAYVRHSQLASGSPVICAGEFWVKGATTDWGPTTEVDTVIAKVNDASGHYKPSGSDCLYYVVQQLQAIGIPTDATELRWTEDL